MTSKQFKIKRQQAEYNFAELCDSIGVTLQDGMRLFLHTNIYIDKYVAMDIPFIGHGLHKSPYFFVAVQTHPEHIRLNLETKLEIIKRMKLMDPKLKCILKDRFGKRVQVKTRTRLRAYIGMRDTFVGTISAFRVIDQTNPYLLKVCVNDVAFAATPNDVLTDHTWILVPTTMIMKDHLVIGDVFTFTGVPVEYARPRADAIDGTVNDVGIRADF